MTNYAIISVSSSAHTQHIDKKSSKTDLISVNKDDLVNIEWKQDVKE